MFLVLKSKKNASFESKYKSFSFVKIVFNTYQSWLFLATLILIGWLGLVYTSAQYKPKQIEKERKTRLQEVKEKREVLSQIKTRREVSLNELSFIKMQIQVQSQLIQTLEQEVDSLQSHLTEIQDAIQKLEEKLVQLRKEYAQMIYATARSQHNLHKLSFIFASDSFYELYRRTKYLQQYTEARRNQVQHIRDTQTQLIEKETLAKKIAEEKLKLLEEKKPEINTLKALKEEKDKLLVSLSKKEKTLKQELKESQNKLNNLDKLVGDLVKEQNTNTATRPTRPRQKKSTVDTKELSQSFTKNKGRMPAPVNKGFIASYFGKQKHPVLKNVMIDNAGIEIQTGSNQGVKAVFEGEVSTIATIPGMGGQVLMLQHGDYFTVYAKIDHLIVKVGDWINKGEEFAEVFTDNKGASILQFQVWKGSKKLNPTDWVRKP